MREFLGHKSTAPPSSLKVVPTTQELCHRRLRSENVFQKYGKPRRSFFYPSRLRGHPNFESFKGQNQWLGGVENLFPPLVLEQSVK